MSLADQLDALLAASEARLATELHTPGQTTARSYARSIWALEDDLRQLATTARIAEGTHS